MRITILAAGSQGDVRPFSALGTGLARLGHEVTLASHQAYESIARSAGLTFAPIRGNPMDIVQGEAGQAWLSSMNNPVKFLASTSRIAGDILDSLNDDAWIASKRSEALIYSLPLSLSGQTIADAHGIPGIPGALYPLHPTRAFPSIMTPNLPHLGGGANWLSGFVVEQAFWRMFRSHQNRWRRTRLGLPPLPSRSPFSMLRKQGVPVLYGYSPSLIPVPGDWHGAAIVCGYWFQDSEEGWSPPGALSDFLSTGEPPIYVGFGSMASEDPERTTAMVLRALRTTGQRAVLASGWGGMRAGSLPETVFAIDSVPHDWLFPRVAAAVHHGGAGTTAAALRAGVPSIVVPFFADQFFWGHRLEALGLSPAPVPKRKLSAGRLAGALRCVAGTPDIRRRCRAMAATIAAEKGVDTAAAAADGYLRRVSGDFAPAGAFRKRGL